MTAAHKHGTLSDRNPESVVGVPWNEDGYAGDPAPDESSAATTAQDWAKRWLCHFLGHRWGFIRDLHLAEGQTSSPGTWVCLRCFAERRSDRG